MKNRMQMNEGEVLMKMNRKIHKKIFDFTIALIFIMGLSCPTYISYGQEQSEDDGHSGGFVVKIDKIEGAMDPTEILFGNVDIPNGQITGITITKKIAETEHGPLIINIKSPGPIPIENLKAKVIGMPFFTGICEKSRDDWICMQGVEMTLSEQSVSAIELPNATVESCYEGQCADDKQKNAETLALTEDDLTIDDIDKGINSLNAIMVVVDEKLEQAVEMEQTIINEKQAEKVEEALVAFDNNRSDEEQLVDNANAIRENYSKLNENVSEFALTSAVVNDILKQATQTLEQFDKEIAKMGESLTEDANKAGKKKKQTLETLAAQEEINEKIAKVKDKISEVQKKIAKYEKQLEPLEKSSTTMLDNLTQFYNRIQEESKNLEKVEQNEQVEQIRELLDVAEPSKELEKRLQDMLEEVKDTNLAEQTEEQEKIIEEANQQAKSSVLSISLVQEIGESDEEIDENIEDESERWKQRSKQLAQLEKEFQKVVGLARLPETLFMKHELKVVLDGQHEYRSDMLDNINHWQKLLSTLKEKQEEFEQALKQHEMNQAAIDELANVILKFKERYTSAELITIAKYIPIDSHLVKERKLSEVIKNGEQIINEIDPILEESQQQLETLEANSSKLVYKKMMVNFLDEEMFEQYEKEFASFKQNITQLEQPIKQLNNLLVIAEDLLGEDVSNHEDLESIFETIAAVAEMVNDLESIIQELDALPYFSKVKELVNEMESLKTEMEEMLQ